MSSEEREALAASSARMVEADPVFIVGHPRSGTSMLFRILQRHPAFRPREMDLHESQVITRMATAFSWNDARPRQLLGFMLGDRDEYRAFLHETRSLRRRTALTAPIALPTRGGVPTPLWRAQGMHLLVRSYFAHAWTARGCQRLIDKSPRNVPHLDKLQLVSPKGRMLFMSRHPVDTLASYRARVRRDPNAKWADVSPEKFVRIYRQGVAGAIAASRQQEVPLFFTRYEDFTENPAAEFSKVCDFLGEPFLESCLEGERGEQRQAVASKLLYGPVATNVRKWQEDVDEATAHKVERALTPVMADAGYHPYT